MDSARKGARWVPICLVFAITAAAPAHQRTAPPPPDVEQSDDPCAPAASCPNEHRGTVDGPPAESRGESDREPRRDRGGDGDRNTLFGILAAVGVALLVDQLTGDEWASTEKLDKEGPQFPSRQALGQFQVQGYAGTGWPLVVDLEAQPGTTTWLEMRVKGKKLPLAELAVPRVVGRQVVVLPLPETGWKTPRVARFSIRSAIIRPGERPAFQPLKVYAVGAGPYAVGSTTLAVDRFQPRNALRPADVNYSVVSKRFFSRSVLEVLRLPPKANARLEQVGRYPLSPLDVGSHRGSWGALKLSPSPASGVYQLQARAWRVGAIKSERDWTGAIAPNYVFIR